MAEDLIFNNLPVLKLLKLIYKYIGSTITAIFGLLLIVAAYSYLISPNVIHKTVYLSLIFPFILWSNIAILIFWIIQKNKIAFITIIAIASSWGSIYRYFPININNTEYTGGDTVKVMSFNTCCFAKMTPHKGEKINPIIEFIKSSDADVVCLQEYAVGRALNSLQENDLDSAFAKIYPYRKVFLNDNHYYESGLACLSKYPITNAEPIIAPVNTNGSIMYSIDIKGRVIKFVVNHLESNRLSSDDRGLFNYVTSHITESDTLMDNVKRQLIWKIAAAAKRRALQADKIAETVKDFDRDIIICGDFNDTQQSYVYNKIRGDLKDAYVETCFGPDITYHADKFFFRIDHILYGKGLKCLNTYIDKSIKDSDHYPIISTFEIIP